MNRLNFVQKVLILSSLVLLSPWFLFPAHAQILERIEIPSSFNPVGSGARALGMGGAFIAIADDATAASWNPAGLIQLERPEISIVGAFLYRSEYIEFGTKSESSGWQDANLENLNYISLTYPVYIFRRNMVLSVNYQHLFDFNRNWKFPLNVSSSNLNLTREIDYQQKGRLSALGLAYAIQIMPNFSLGLTLNFFDDGFLKNSWEQTTFEKGTGVLFGIPVNVNFESRDRFSFKGHNFNIGALYNPIPNLNIGIVIKTPFDAAVKHESWFTTAIVYPTLPPIYSSFPPPFEATTDETLRMPLSYGLGIAYRFSDSYTVAMDLYRTEWDSFTMTNSSGTIINPITGQPIADSSLGATTQVRIGAEYLYIGDRFVIPLRIGAFFDPTPAEGGTEDYIGITLGSGLAYKRFVFDGVYQARFGRNVGRSILKNLDFSQNVTEHTVFMSLIIHF